MKTKDQLIEIALNAACKAVQDELGVDGSVAGAFFGEERTAQFNELFGKYIGHELSFLEENFQEFQTLRKFTGLNTIEYDGCVIEIVGAGQFQVNIEAWREAGTHKFEPEKWRTKDGFDEEHITNGKRADEAAAALGKSEIEDLLANLMHLCDREKIPFAECLSTASNHYENER